jgi:hypothetical protein
MGRGREWMRRKMEGKKRKQAKRGKVGNSSNYWHRVGENYWEDICTRRARSILLGSFDQKAEMGKAYSTHYIRVMRTDLSGKDRGEYTTWRT